MTVYAWTNSLPNISVIFLSFSRSCRDSSSVVGNLGFDSSSSAGGCAAGSSSSLSVMPSRPLASKAAPTRYGLERPDGARFSMCRLSAEPLPPLTRTNALRSSGPHDTLVGLKVWRRRRLKQLRVGARSAYVEAACRSWPATNCLPIVDSPVASAIEFLPESTSTRLMGGCDLQL